MGRFPKPNTPSRQNWHPRSAVADAGLLSGFGAGLAAAGVFPFALDDGARTLRQSASASAPAQRTPRFWQDVSFVVVAGQRQHHGRWGRQPTNGDAYWKGNLTSEAAPAGNPGCGSTTSSQRGQVACGRVRSKYAHGSVTWVYRHLGRCLGKAPPRWLC